jgi:apoptosis-inducing factor 2
MTKFAKEVTDAKKILICGGGIVGVELAGEIAFHPDAANKKIAIGVRGSRLLNQLPEDAHKAADAFLKTKNVELHYNVSDFGKLKKDFDLVLECFGQTYRADFMKKNFASAVAENGQIYVNSHLQVSAKGSEQPLASNVFAFGDCSLTPIKEVKNIPSLKFLGFTLEKNLQALVNGQALSESIPKTLPIFAAVSIGPSYGMFVMNSNVIAGDENGKAKYDFASTWVKIFKGDIEAFKGNKGYLQKTLGDLSAS